MQIESDRTTSSFNNENEISKIELSIPFNELLKNYEYREKITKMVGTDGEYQHDTLSIFLDPRIEDTDE